MAEEEKQKESEKDAVESSEPLAKCEKERDEYLAGWQRAKADLINYKKEEAARFQEMIKFSNAVIIEDLINILDSFDLGLTILKDGEPAKKGMELIQSQLKDSLKKYGLEAIPFAVGEKFDPAHQEAIAEVESEKAAGTVVEEVGRGYFLHGKVIRPTRVKLSKGQ